MSNVHLPFVSVYQRMTDFVHTLAYAGVIRNSVTWVLLDAFTWPQIYYDIALSSYLMTLLIHIHHTRRVFIVISKEDDVKVIYL